MIAALKCVAVIEMCVVNAEQEAAVAVCCSDITENRRITASAVGFGNAAVQLSGKASGQRKQILRRKQGPCGVPQNSEPAGRVNFLDEDVRRRSIYDGNRLFDSDSDDVPGTPGGKIIAVEFGSAEQRKPVQFTAGRIETVIGNG